MTTRDNAHPNTLDAEATIRLACDTGDYESAVGVALKAYGGEVLSFLIARLRVASDAEEAYAMFVEDLWKGLPQFEFRCSVRGWLYTVARNAANRYAVANARRGQRQVEFDSTAHADAVPDAARTTTAPHRRTTMKDIIHALRARLNPEDRTLLLLHVDRNLPWREVAMIVHESGETLEESALTREAARLRKRFERVKSELRDLAIQAGAISNRTSDA